MSDFIPTIEVRDDELHLLAPHDVKDRTWYNLSLITDLGIITRTGGYSTQLFVGFERGYDLTQATGFLLAAVYLATVNDFDAVFKKTPKARLEAACEMFPNLKTVDGKRFNQLVCLYLNKIANSKLDRAFDGFMNTRYNLNWYTDLLDEAIECYRRYKAADFLRRSHPNESVNIKRLKTILEEVRRTNLNIDEYRMSAIDRTQYLRSAFTDSEHPKPSEFGSGIRTIKFLANQAKDESSRMSTTDTQCLDLIRSIRLETPPAPGK